MHKPLADFADIFYGKSPSEVLDGEGLVPVFGTGGTYAKAARALFLGPAVVLPRKGSLGSPHYSQGPFWPSDTTFAAIPKVGVDAKWLFYQLLSFELEKLNEATGVPSISRDWLAKINIPDQRGDVSRLVRLVIEAVDTQIEATEALIAKQERLRAGLMQDLFTRGVDENGELRPPRDEAPHLYHETELGWLPKAWDVDELQSYASVNRGKFAARPRNDPKFYGGEYPFIQTGDVSGNSGRSISNHRQTLNKLGLLTSRLFPEGAIMISIAANIGDAATLSYAMCAPDSVVGVVANDQEDRAYLQLAILQKKRWLESRAPQTAQRNINLEDLRPLILPIPQSAERERIALSHATLLERIVQMEEELGKLRLQKTGLMQDLLTGTVSVKPLLEKEQA